MGSFILIVVVSEECGLPITPEERQPIAAATQRLQDRLGRVRNKRARARGLMVSMPRRPLDPGEAREFVGMIERHRADLVRYITCVFR